MSPFQAGIVLTVPGLLCCLVKATEILSMGWWAFTFSRHSSQRHFNHSRSLSEMNRLFMDFG